MALVKIITGGINSGKTTLASKLISTYDLEGLRVEGYLSLSDDKNKDSYYIFDLASKKRIPAVCENPPAEEEGWRRWDFSRFYFSDSAFKEVDNIIDRLLAHQDEAPTDLVFIDEFGPLELSGHGSIKAVQRLVKEFDGTIVMVIREGLVKESISRLGITVAEIIEAGYAQ